MTMLNRLANQRFPTTAMTTGAPGVNAMPLAAPPPELRAKREAEYQPELMSHMELLRRNPGMMKIGEMPGGPKDIEDVIRLLVRLDRISPKALPQLRELFGQPGPGVRPVKDMREVISKVAPTAELKGGTLSVAMRDKDPLLQLLEGSGVEQGVLDKLRVRQDLRTGGLRDEMGQIPANVETSRMDDARGFAAAGEADTRLPISGGGQKMDAISFKPIGSQGTGIDATGGFVRRGDEGVEAGSDFERYLADRTPAPRYRRTSQPRQASGSPLMPAPLNDPKEWLMDIRHMANDPVASWPTEIANGTIANINALSVSDLTDVMTVEQLQGLLSHLKNFAASRSQRTNPHQAERAAEMLVFALRRLGVNP